MQTGEPATTSAPAEETKVLIAEVIQVVFESPVKVTLGKSVVKEPHWKKATAVEESTWSLGAHTFSGTYSRRPAVFLRKSAGGSRVATVTVKVTASNVSGNGKLVGVLGGLRFEGDCPLGPGEHIVVAKLLEAPDAFQAYSGNVSWVLRGGEFSAPLNGTRAELYFVYGTPHRAYRDGVWAEALRFLAARPRLRGIEKPADAVARIVRYCHGSHGLKYDSAGGGRSNYGVSPAGGRFRLSSYLARDEEFANCYDQAGAVEALCGAAGIVVQWIYLNPYGFIQRTNLLGYGTCNNPFFLASTPPGAKVTPRDDPARTPFGNHAFGRWNAKVLDACAGPHIGTESDDEYVRRSIDPATTLYRLYAGFRPGTATDMQVCPGLSAVS